MFVGSVPKEVVNQLVQVAAIKQRDSIYVCCSGSFRVDIAVKHAFEARVHGNDVSLLSCAIGKMLVDSTLDFEFINDYDFIEQALAGRPYRSRVAALNASIELAKFNPNNDYGAKHLSWYRSNIDQVLDVAETKLSRNYQAETIDGFYMGDFQEHARVAAQNDAVVIAFPPTYKGGYETMYKRLDQNTRWSPPDYGLWNPDLIGDWLDDLADLGVRHCVFVDHKLEGGRHRPLSKFVKPRAHPIYLYGDTRGASSYRARTPNAEPFAYTPVEPGRLTEQSTIEVKPVQSKHFNFLRNRYLAKGIDYTDGMFNFVVLIDGTIAGGFCYTRDRMGARDNLYLLSDFSTSRERRLSKLIAMIAASREAVRPVEIRTLLSIKSVATTVFTDKPVSMKYRGIFELYARKPGFLQYTSEVREQTLRETYEHWWHRFARR